MMNPVYVMALRRESPVSQFMGVLDSHGIELRHFDSFHSAEEKTRLRFNISNPEVGHWFQEHIGTGSFTHFKQSLHDALKSIHPDLQTRVKSGEMLEGDIPLESVEIHSDTPAGVQILQDVHAEIQRRKRHFGYRLMAKLKGILDD